MFFLVVAIIFITLWILEKKKFKKQQSETTSRIEQLQLTVQSVQAENENLKTKYSSVIDAEAAANEIIDLAKRDAEQINQLAKQHEEKAAQSLRSSQEAANAIIEQANIKAKEIAGDAFEAQGKAKEFERIAAAMKRTIEGYGDEWIKPSYSLLDELADEFGYDDAGKRLKEARALSVRMVKDGLAANCDYVEDYRRITAIQFVIDAFNGKVDSILSKVKQDNYGILEQKIKDAYQLVNKNGSAFRNAHILPEYLNARLDELKWATVVQELRAKAAEEQRAIREKMREEERARREYERAQKEAAKEEAMLQKAMEKAKALLASANDEQKTKYESQLKELEEKLKIAEEKNQRAISMAQQTKRGTVYVISNVGSFGENVYKVGMTRRLDPLDRIKELGDASVPFPFDVHAFIECDDAPTLENTLHKELSLMQMNKVNPRKEFFRIDLSTIKKLVEKKGLETNWTMAAKAAEYRETISIEERLKKDPTERARWEKFMESVEMSDMDCNAESDE